MTPLMVLFLFFDRGRCRRDAVDPGDPDIMSRPPRDPKLPIANPAADRLVGHLCGRVLFVAAFVPLVIGPDTRTSTSRASAMTMRFAVVGLGTVFNGLVKRREPASGFAPPILRALAISSSRYS